MFRNLTERVVCMTNKISEQRKGKDSLSVLEK